MSDINQEKQATSLVQVSPRNCRKMSSSISSFSMCNVSLPTSSSLKGNGGSNSCLPVSVKTAAKPKQIGVIVMATNGRDSLDHLQRVSPQQTQPKKRTTQTQGGAPPVVVWDYRIPAARTVQQMMDTMDRLMEDPFVYSERNGYPRTARRRTPWDIKESQASYKIRYDMPGMTRNDVKVWVEEKMLVLEAEKKQKTEVVENEEEHEWPPESYGKYSNRIALPETVDIEKIRAEVRDGVLYITIPKAKETSKKIDISVN